MEKKWKKVGQKRSQKLEDEKVATLIHCFVLILVDRLTQELVTLSIINDLA